MKLKHDPEAEFRGSIYRSRDPKALTRVLFPAEAFTAAIADVALDIPGAKKAQIQRLTSIDSAMISIFGVPFLHMSVVRCSDMNRTPDIRTRAIFPDWACRVKLVFSHSHLPELMMGRLMAYAGILRGIGESRPQKGRSNGQFLIVDESDKRFQAIVSKQGVRAQDEAIARPICYDDETEELYSWAVTEIESRRKVSDPVETHRRVAKEAKGNGKARLVLNATTDNI